MTGFNIEVKVPGGDIQKLVVERNDTIQSIKTRVATKANLEASILRFRLNGVELEDDKKVNETDIREGSLINASLNSIQIKVKIPNGETLELDVDPADQVSSIKT